jgi:hypothetical protein
MKFYGLKILFYFFIGLVNFLGDDEFFDEPDYLKSGDWNEGFFDELPNNLCESDFVCFFDLVQDNECMKIILRVLAVESILYFTAPLAHNFWAHSVDLKTTDHCRT